MMSKIIKFDLALLEKLNGEYKKRDNRPPSVKRDRESNQEKARRRIELMQKQLGVSFKGLKVLELGCGAAWISAFLPEMAKVKQAIGIDISSYEAWDEHNDKRIKLIEGDLAVEPLVKPGSVDVIVSGAVMEHVTRPIEMISAIYDTLRPGGVAWLYFNLHRGPRASHRYNEIYFPWPHLLFDNSVCQEFYAKYPHDELYPGISGQDEDLGFVWVNHMTIAEYLLTIQQAGFEILELKRRVMPIDVPFYLRFEDVLGRYSALDLETDFATFMIRKPEPQKRFRQQLTNRPATEPYLHYAGRQKELVEAISNITSKS